MGTLQGFMADPNPSATMAHRYADFGSFKPKGSYIAVAMVVAGMIPDWGVSYTYGTGTPVTGLMSGTTIVGALKDAAFNGKCWFLGDGLVTGKAGKPTEMKQTIAFGSRTMPRTTGEVAETVEFVVADTFMNIDFWNSLRSGAFGPVDVYLFTNVTVQVIRYGVHKPVFMDIGSEIPGSFEQDIPGGFKVAWTSKLGQLSPQKGVRETDLQFETLKYTFGAVTPAATGFVLVTGTTNRYTLASATAGKIKRQVVEAGAVRYSIYKNTNEAIPAAELVTIDSDTGEVNMATTQPTGRYIYTIAAENATGVYGTWQIEVIKA